MIEILENYPKSENRSPEMINLISDALSTIPFFSSMTK